MQSIFRYRGAKPVFYGAPLRGFATFAGALALAAGLTACSRGQQYGPPEPVSPLTVPRPEPSLQALADPVAVMHAAEAAERAGDLATAERLYSDILAAHPAHLGAQRGQARVIILGGRGAVGTGQLAALYVQYPDHEPLRRDLVNGYLYTGQIDRVRDHLVSRGKQVPLTLAEQLQLAVLQEALGEASRARRIWDDLRLEAPDDPQVQMFLALAEALDGAYPAAIRRLQRLQAAAAAHSLSVKAMQASVYALAGNWQQAVEIAETALPPAEVRARRTLYQVLPQLRRREQVRALLLGAITREAEAALQPKERVEP